MTQATVAKGRVLVIPLARIWEGGIRMTELHGHELRRGLALNPLLVNNVRQKSDTADSPNKTRLPVCLK
ncbi:hypothetical protein OKW46_006545 [Paraburkholderia sp. WSM4179]|nr:hypothetical protein [Paraburkholderia sp. WSM4179]